MKRHNDLQQRIQRHYAGIVRGDASSLDSDAPAPDAVIKAKSKGYTDADLARVPPGAITGMGCGNPIAHAGLQPGETVLDIGCGGGLDAFLAARAVGPSGMVIGIDPTPQMIERARQNAQSGDFANVRFELGEVERLPLPDQSVDVVISNCVINHCQDKPAAFREVLRVLNSGGRMHIADLVTIGAIPQEAFNDPIWGAWLTAASSQRAYCEAIRSAGFVDIRVVSEGPFPMAEASPQLAGRIRNIRVSAHK